MITYKLKINQQEPRVLNSDMEFVTGDVGAYRLELEFYDNGKRMDITDSLLTVRAKRADGVCYSEGGEIVDNTGVFVPKNNLYSMPGELTLEIALSDSAGNYVTTKILTASVIKGIGDAPNGAQDDVSVYVTLLAQTKKLIDEANKLFETESSALEAQISELEESLNTKADKETSGGGFVAGEGSAVEDSAVAVGKGANAKNGGFAGGLSTFSNAGGAVGQGAKAYGYGGAVGMNTVAGKGFSGGFGAVAAKKTHDEDRVNCIQLGEGTNSVEKSLQVYNHQLMGPDGKIPAEALKGKLIQEIHTSYDEAEQVRNSLTTSGLYLFSYADIMVYDREALLVIDFEWNGHVVTQYRFRSNGSVSYRETTDPENGWSEWKTFAKTGDLENAISAANLWGGNVSSLSQLPENPKAGTYCYVSADITNGVKYTGKVSDLFTCDAGGISSYELKFTPPAECIYTDPDSAAVNPTSAFIYNAAGVYAGDIKVNATQMPDSFDVESLGVTSENDTVTFYLGINNGGNMPEKITDFPANSMIFWTGEKWVCIPAV